MIKPHSNVKRTDVDRIKELAQKSKQIQDIYLGETSHLSSTFNQNWTKYFEIVNTFEPPLRQIKIQGFSQNAEDGNKILSAIADNFSIFDTLEVLNISENPNWFNDSKHGKQNVELL